MELFAEQIEEMMHSNGSFAMNNLGKEWRGQAHGALADTYAAKDVWDELHKPVRERKNSHGPYTR